jgi:hypothetical protein
MATEHWVDDNAASYSRSGSQSVSGINLDTCESGAFPGTHDNLVRDNVALAEPLGPGGWLERNRRCREGIDELRGKLSGFAMELLRPGNPALTPDGVLIGGISLALPSPALAHTIVEYRCR